MNSIIIGTSGHIDHGKTALIKALNGYEGDKTSDEIKRGITIDLSFSNLNNGIKNIAFIDVPGHENLVKTMISGAFQFDACMLVIAANEGLKPQTKEHIEILNLLNVKNIILVFSKCDLVGKNEQLEVKNSVLDFIKDFSNLEILRSFFVSIKDKNSIDALKNYLFTIQRKTHDQDSVFRYYIDRVFQVKGHGTVVTGGVLKGTLKVGEQILNLDLNESFILRNLEVHSRSAKTVEAPNRAALNLSGDKTYALKKGQILSKKGFWRGFFEADCFVSGDLTHNSEVVFCVGSKQVNAKAALLKDNFFTFKFNKMMFLEFNEPFILLKNSRVIGGGFVLNPVSEPLKKDVKSDLLSELNNMDFVQAFEILSRSHRHGFGLISSLQRFGMSTSTALDIASNLKNVFVDKKAACIYTNDGYSDVKEFIKFIINKNKDAMFSPSSINTKLSWASTDFIEAVLNELETNKIVQKNGSIYTKFGTNFDELNTTVESKIYDILEKGYITPKAPYNIYDELDIDKIVGDAALKKLTKAKKVVRLEHNLFISSNALNKVINMLRDIIKNEGKVNITSVKNHLNLSRKYALAYLEYLDKFADIKKFENDRLFV
ncbi:TPA: selenocysteine-specific translation elongation factor [Campylobacter fetus subsp. venerealis]|nr:selenocysteine-specific translation elongation factor [Campylobacter fetus subsp. venerealis]HDX6283338.1 selenocysteine-specific translation elongation factor [Campylobacter fetus subsp. venerealis]HDX6285335.1 selenocysteine-specific translation elongation factor [Campylobacter fetus subsp. venerealis]HDX6287033.1 selenocysteine-specific translation elongation factor [Campylobacter fetus subsp. venerealis]HDX6288496.1 selenocysteine-specific translation elongation factor [Campylobacter fet